MAAPKMLIIILLVLASGVFVWSVWSFLVAGQMLGTVGYTPENFAAAGVAELPDKCATPPGYSDQQWFEHMSHHPDQYRECLP